MRFRFCEKLIGLGLLPVLAVLAACGGEGAPPSPPPPEVDVMTIRAASVSYTIELPARVQAKRTAEVRARVDGIVERRLYVEGSDLKAGTPMFIIDPQEMRAAYNAARAALARAESVLANARQDVERYRPLVKREAISKQEYDAATARAAQAAADVESARAQADRAALDLNYARVTAPISGRAGRAQVTEGALVSASQATLLATIEQLDPVYVNFSQSNAELLRLRRAVDSGALQSGGVNRIQVHLVLDDGSEYPLPGRVDFLDMAVDPSTGSVSLRAEFPNPRNILLPGQFVRAQVDIGSLREGILIPQIAVKMADSGASVFVVDKKGHAVPRSIRLGEMQGDKWVVLEGLRPGEKIVTNGVQKVMAGQPVRVAGSPSARAPQTKR
ncbi:efflux transporter periplasmic adaptor subunit [Tardibacter chloracetimidivorans]|uniref:Efflux transporter periplasmic adaptor subunit n=1 Tax=Tardibacter chloracetimidivorans TaxID=1921510 RepID=A0A1L3ZYU8_9SPHN|nr:efflux RND transporter periplasmic adaptor subunit [Tardibacter chloracetimidivorans]API60785.1 efflux transporter periplasmic adaptor subunit [Tardibacter chloracetimidivorans]